MIKNFLSIFVIFFIFLFFFNVFKKYTSDAHKKKINLNRMTIESQLRENLNDIKILNNDTNNVIEFNTGYNSQINLKTKRKFWELFNQNK